MKCELSRYKAFRAWYESGGKVAREEVREVNES